MLTFDPAPRDFSHINLSNPSISWGDKFERHCLAGCDAGKQDVLIGDSSLERLSRPALFELSQKFLPGWTNFGIGGDRAQHLLWRIQHAGFPDNPGRTIYSCGSNNIRSDSSKECAKIANTILKTIHGLLDKHPALKMTVIGIFPRENITKCRAAAQINSLLAFKLPASVLFIPPPKVFLEHELPNDIFFESDNVLLNYDGYEILLRTIESHLSLTPETLPEPQPSLRNPVLDDYAIGELEFLGVGGHTADGKASLSQPQVGASLHVSLPTAPTPSSRPSPSPPLPMPPDPYPPLPTPCPFRPSHPVPVLSVMRRKNVEHPSPIIRTAPTARQAYPASAPTTKLACHPTFPKRLSYPRTKPEQPRGSWVAHSLSDQFRRKAPKPAPPAPYKHSPPPPLVSLSMQDNEQPKLVKKMSTPSQLHQTKPPKMPKGTHVSKPRPPKPLHQLAPVAQELTGPPLSAPLHPIPTRSGSIISPKNGAKPPFAKQSGVTNSSLNAGHCILLAIVLFLLPIAFTNNAYIEAECAFSKNSPTASVKNLSSPLNISQTVSNDYYQTFPIDVKYIDINVIFLILLFFHTLYKFFEN